MALTQSKMGAALLAAVTALTMTADQAEAQRTPSDPGVAIYNESMHQARVYAFAVDEEDRVLLGWIGANELEFYTVPPEARTRLGDYHLAVQQVSPMPQIGVSAEAHPLVATPLLDPEPIETVRLIIDGNFGLSHVIVR